MFKKKNHKLIFKKSEHTRNGKVDSRKQKIPYYTWKARRFDKYITARRKHESAITNFLFLLFTILC